MKTSIYTLLIIVTLTSTAAAQSRKDKLEVGVQATSLSLFDPDFPGDVTHAGAGGRVTYNINRSIAAEAEINFLAQKAFILRSDGHAIQAQFGVKAGKRFEKFGLFAKVRPGFLSVNRVFSLEPGPGVVINGIPTFIPKIERETFFTIDVGGVLELYPSKRTVVRFDAGDTLVRHPDRFDIVFGLPPTVQLARAAKFTNNFQFTAGVSFRLDDFPAEEGDARTSGDAREETPRYEVGVQFTSMSVEPPATACVFCATLNDDFIHTEPGFGGRFTFNLTDNIAFEGEGNYFTRDRPGFPDPAGHMFQAQFGGKVGKRFERWGLFGKARPGFVGFTKVTEVTGTRVVTLGSTSFVVPDFREGKAFYPSLDLGGVVEFYISRRWMARFDVGDTIIRYGELRTVGFVMSMPIAVRPAETHHNFQFGSGIGFRF